MAKDSFDDGDQVDLFLESIINAPVKDERALMEFPFFSLQKQKRIKPFIFDDGIVRIEVKPGPYGIATIWDKDVLIYVTSLLNSRIERGETVSRTVYFPAYDFLRLTGRGTGKQAYELFMSALDRLQSTTIRTTITSGKEDERERRGFSWIDSYRIVERTNSKGKKIMAAVEVTLNKWMFRAIVENRRVLTIDRGYFKLKMGLERRLYELARKHCGRQPIWQISLPRLAEKCGSEMELRNFKVYLNKIAAADSLPQYHVGLAFDGKSDIKKTLGSNLGADMWRWGRNERILVVFNHKTTELLPPSTEPEGGYVFEKLGADTIEDASWKKLHVRIEADGDVLKRKSRDCGAVDDELVDDDQPLD